MATETMTSDATNWPSLGNPPPSMNSLSPTDPNPEWEMIADDEENTTPTNNVNVDDHVFIMPGAAPTNAAVIKGRPRSATIGGEAVKSSIPRAPSSGNIGLPKSNSSMSSGGSHRRLLRRCASTPDLVMGDNAHEVIVEDESDEESDEVDAELIEVTEEGVERELTESFELLSDNNGKDVSALDEEDGQDSDEPIMVDEDITTGEEESATLVSTPSMGTSSWTMASATPTTPAPAAGGVWGMKKSMSFKDMLAKNIDANATNVGVFGKDKALTEAKLRDSHRRHHLRVRTKPKLNIVVSDTATNANCAGSRKMLKHAHSTGDLTKMLIAVEEGHESSFGQGGRNRRAMKKQLSAMQEEEEEGDFIIGRGSGGGEGGGGGGGCEIMGDTDAMDYYHRKEHGSKSTGNKKKERPDEAKRREIIMHKKEMQRKNQQASQKGGGGNNDAAAGGGKKKKKNEKGFGGKKERRRL